MPGGATHGPSRENAEIRGDGHVPGALDEIPKAVVVAPLMASRGRHGPIIGRSRTPFKSSKTLAGRPRGSETVRRSDENSPLNVQNVRGHSGAIWRRRRRKNLTRSTR
jgi:hypothetical protein